MYHNILVPLDRSKRAEAILPHVEHLARRYGANVIFLHVVQPDMTPWGPEIPNKRYYFDEINRQIKATEVYLVELEGRFHSKGINTKRLIFNGSIVETILLAADIEGVDLVAIASHGWSGLPRVFYGSVAASVLQKIDRPLLLMRSRVDK